jgi:hypothetical protein
MITSSPRPLEAPRPKNRPSPEDTGRTGGKSGDSTHEDRNEAEMLQELRVAGLGIQILFGFLLSLPFTMRFKELGHGQRALYLTSLVLAALSTAAICTPVAFHRLVWRRHERPRLLRVTNIMAIIGLALVAGAITAAIGLVVSFVEQDLVISVLIGAAVALAFGGLWFVLPLLKRSPVR